LGSDATGRNLQLAAIWNRSVDKTPPLSTENQITLSDEELVQQVRAGNETALGVLFDRYSRIVRGIGFQALRDRGEAEELVQDVFLYVHQKASLFDPARGTAKVWLIQVAYHKALDRRTYLQRRRFYDGTDIDEIEDNVKGALDIEREFTSKYVGEQLRKACSELSERQRMTIELFFFQGLTLREISQQLDESYTNVRHHYYRALQKLKACAEAVGLTKV